MHKLQAKTLDDDDDTINHCNNVTQTPHGAGFRGSENPTAPQMVFSVTWEEGPPCKVQRWSTKVHRFKHSMALEGRRSRICITSSTSSTFDLFSTVDFRSEQSTSLRQQRAQQLVGQGGQQRQVPHGKIVGRKMKKRNKHENTNEIGTKAQHNST